MSDDNIAKQEFCSTCGGVKSQTYNLHLTTTNIAMPMQRTCTCSPFFPAILPNPSMPADSIMFIQPTPPEQTVSMTQYSKVVQDWLDLRTENEQLHKKLAGEEFVEDGIRYKYWKVAVEE